MVVVARIFRRLFGILRRTTRTTRTTRRKDWNEVLGMDPAEVEGVMMAMVAKDMIDLKGRELTVEEATGDDIGVAQ